MLIALLFIFKVFWILTLLVLIIVYSIKLNKKIKLYKPVDASLINSKIEGDLPPAMLSYLYNQTTNFYNILGELVYLLNNGYIEVIEVDEKKAFRLLKKEYRFDELLYSYQKNILEVLFPSEESNIVSKRKNIQKGLDIVTWQYLEDSRVFYFNKSFIYKALGKDLFDKGYRKVVTEYKGSDAQGVNSLILLGIVIVFISLSNLNGEAWMSLLIIPFTIYFIYLLYKISRYSLYANPYYASVSGFKNYLSQVEEPRALLDLKEGRENYLLAYIVSFMFSGFKALHWPGDIGDLLRSSKYWFSNERKESGTWRS